MLYDETNKEVTIKWKGLWKAEYLIVSPTWRDIARIVGSKLFGRRDQLKVGMDNLPNALMDEGEASILEIYFRNNNTLQASPFFFGLGNGSVPADTATLATITEVSGTGYARVACVRGVSDWGATVLDTGDYQTTSATKTFSATGTWTAADYLFLCDVASGTAGDLIATVALSVSRSLVNGDSMNVSMKVKLQ